MSLQQQNRINEGLARALQEIRERDYPEGNEELIIDQLSEVEPEVMKQGADLIIHMAGWSGNQIPAKQAAEFSLIATGFFLALADAYATTADAHAHDSGYYEENAA